MNQEVKNQTQDQANSLDQSKTNEATATETQSGASLNNTKSIGDVMDKVTPVVVPEKEQSDPPKDDYAVLVKRLGGVRLLKDASKLLARKEEVEKMIPIKEKEAESARQMSTNASTSLERLAYKQRGDEAEVKVKKLRSCIEAIDTRAEELDKSSD
ncbi:MAG: hypothetical protein H8E85_00585 [Candidatus Marinimicrobia bacterium]|nr:hypothetical protein [Candidatus Neomarinimicrobiota bacterium]